MFPKKPAKTSRSSSTSARVPTKRSPLDLNTASARELQALPGVGPAAARRIVDSRPYASVADLSRAGLPKATLDRITPLVTVTGKGGPTVPMGAADRPMPAPSPKVARSKAAAPPSPGMVWADPGTNLYRVEGQPGYGTTRDGKWMTESDAIRAGFRKAEKKK
jgi:competence protein ComEA